MPAEGLKSSDVEAVRHEVDRAIESALASLRTIEDTAQQRLHESTVERQQLDIFLDELHYRLQFLSKGRESGVNPLTATGPLTDEQLHGMERQEEGLLE